MELSREPSESEYLVALVAGTAVGSLITASPDERPLSEVVDTAVTYGEQIVQEVVHRADERVKPIGHRYECKHGHVTVHYTPANETPPQEVDCDYEGGRSDDYQPCTKTAGLVGKLDDYQPAPLPSHVLQIDEFSSQAADGGDKRMGISVEWVRGPEIGPAGNTLTPDETRALMGRIVNAVEQFVDERGGSDLTVLYDLD